MDSRVDSLAAILDFWQGRDAASDRRGKRRLIWQALKKTLKNTKNTKKQ